MSQKSEQVGYLYVNGLGYGNLTPKDRLAKWWWKRSGRTIEHAGINWYGGGSLEEKVEQVENKVDQMLKVFGGVAIIGGSAGGGLALNVFSKMKHKNVCAITAHARVKVGDYEDSDRMSLSRRAHMNSRRPAPSFVDSVTYVESVVIPGFSDDDKSRLLNLTQIRDRVVDIDLMKIEGVQTHRARTAGHLGGFLAHLIADRNLIVSFAEKQLT